MTGRLLFETLVAHTAHTQLPQNALRQELEKLFQQAGKSVEDLSLNDVREVLARYLQDVLVDAKAAIIP